MIFRAKPPIRRTGKGIEVDLGPDERALLRALVEDLRGRLTDGADHPDLRRLFPTAYHQDPERDAAYQILARSELLDARLGAVETMLGTLDARLLDDGQLQAWMTVTNQLRLVLGTIIDIGEDDEDDDLDPADPHDRQRLVYHWLTGVLALVVDAGLP